MTSVVRSPPFFTPERNTPATRYKRRARESPPAVSPPDPSAAAGASLPPSEAIKEIRDIKKVSIDKLMDVSYMVNTLTQNMKDPASTKCIKDIRETLIFLKSKIAAMCTVFEQLTLNQEAVKSTAQSMGTLASSLMENRTPDLEEISTLIREQVSTCVQKEVKDALRTELQSLNLGPVRDASNNVSGPSSFSDALKRSANSSGSVKLSKGISVPVSNKIEFSIVPLANAASKFKSSADVEKVIFNTVIPSDFNMKVSRVIRAKSTAVRISADRVDLDKLKSCQALQDAGLEVKTAVKMQPRLLVIGVPSSIPKDDIPEKIIVANSLSSTPDEIKVVHMYSRRGDDSSCNVVIEVSPDVRKQLLALQRLFIGWSSCRVEDHILIRQCYKCLKIGHLSAKCPSSVECCSKCACAHDSRTCNKPTAEYKCANCISQNIADHNHCATDAKVCPFLLNRIKRKIANTSY